MTPKPGRRCTICRHENLIDIQNAITKAIPLQDIAFRYNVQKSSLHRHAQNHMGRGSTRNGTRNTGSGYAKRKSVAPKSRIETDTNEPMDAKAIIREAERLLRRSEDIVTRAEDADDYRLALLGIDRCQKAIDALAKYAGLVGPDTVVNVNTTVNEFAGWPDAAVFALHAFYGALKAGQSVSEAITAVTVNEKPLALNPAPNDNP